MFHISEFEDVPAYRIAIERHSLPTPNMADLWNITIQFHLKYLSYRFVEKISQFSKVLFSKHTLAVRSSCAAGIFWLYSQFSCLMDYLQLHFIWFVYVISLAIFIRDVATFICAACFTCLNKFKTTTLENCVNCGGGAGPGYG